MHQLHRSSVMSERGANKRRLVYLFSVSIYEESRIEQTEREEEEEIIQRKASA